jgi:hypothetical protein
VMGPQLLVEPGKATFFQLWLPLHTLSERFSELRLPERLNGVAFGCRSCKTTLGAGLGAVPNGPLVVVWLGHPQRIVSIPFLHNNLTLLVKIVIIYRTDSRSINETHKNKKN